MEREPLEEYCRRCTEWVKWRPEWRQGVKNWRKWRLYRRCPQCGLLKLINQAEFARLEFHRIVPDLPDIAKQQELFADECTGT